MDIAIFREILALIEKYGVSLTLLILVLFWIGPKINKLWDMMVAERKASTLSGKKEDVERIVGLNTAIKGLLREGLLDTGASWVQLWQFHNGTHGIGKPKIPFMYITLTNEVFKPGFESMLSQFRELPLNMFDTFAERLVTCDILIHNQEMTEPSGAHAVGIGKIMHDYGATFSAMRAIRDPDGMVIGFVSFVFSKSHVLNDENRQKVLDYTQRMSALLASYDEEETNNGKEK